MGQIHPGVPKDYVLSLARQFDIRCFVETGTHRAETAAWAAEHFECVVTIELSPHFYAKSKRELASRPNVQLLLGDSRQHLRELAATLPPAIFWLDAHWGMRETSGEAQQCPLLGELQAIAPCWDSAFVLVDDARFFLAPPQIGYDPDQWPSLPETVTALNRGSDRFVACFEDVLVSLPPTARGLSVSYIRDAEVRNEAAARIAGGGTKARSAARSLRQYLRRPAMLLGRAVGHLPVLFDFQCRFVWFLADRFEWPRLPFEIDFRGYRYPGSGSDVIDSQVFYFGAFERPVVALLDDLALKLAKPDRKPILYDIGANSGQHSLFVARNLQRIYAFEPYAPVREKFEQRIRLNGLHHIEMLSVALGDQDGEAHYYAPITVNRGTGSFLAGVNRENSRTSMLLPVARGDRLVQERGLLPPDIIKLDVEGSEKLVLGGLVQTINRYRPAIVAELSAASRWLFGGEAGLRAKLYDDCMLFDVVKRAVPRGYRLKPFDFARAEQFLCLPRERASQFALPRKLSA